MSENKEVIIYWKSIQLTVIIPEELVWVFALAFGKEFACDDSHCGWTPAKMDSYRYHPNGYHVKVSVWVPQEQKFYDFLEKFCKENNLPVRKKDLKPGIAR